MQLEDYGFWIYEVAEGGPLKPFVCPNKETLMGELPVWFCLKWREQEFMYVSQFIEKEWIFSVHLPVFKSLNRQFTFKEDFSNQSFFKVVKRAIKRYKSAIKASPARAKSTYLNDLDDLLEDICT